MGLDRLFHGFIGALFWPLQRLDKFYRVLHGLCCRGTSQTELERPSDLVLIPV